ncbi:MAG: TlpA family protein disulfide reductase, partial [Chloroflexi bacterium]|nr:TlpA family protein disulfide reductase [Chloroflexota bacterium]
RPLSFTAVGVLLGAALGLVLWRGIPDEVASPGTVPGAPEFTPVVGPLVGSLAPDFSARSLDGPSIRLSELRGRAVVLNFWATWCAPCRAEMPLLDERSRAWAERGLIILGANFDEPEEDVRAFRDELGLSFPLLLDPGGEIQSLYRVIGYPTTYFIDAEGVIRAVHLGVMDEAQLDGYLADLGLV